MSVVADVRGDMIVEGLVARLHAEYGVPRDELREKVNVALSAFTSAPLRTFVPILVEKRLRNVYRVHRA
jgi:hypothetical protein